MDKYTATELAFKNGYEKGYKDATDNNVGSKWIPVSERMPEEFISVLVHIPEMNPCPPVMEAYRIGDGWVTKMAAFDINCATHWMPLPEPPKEEPPKISKQTADALNRMGKAAHGGNDG